jgi:hypothetical protein
MENTTGQIDNEFGREKRNGHKLYIKTVALETTQV